MFYYKFSELIKRLSKKETIALTLSAIVLVVAGLLWIIGIYIGKTVEVPAYGGAWREGIVGQPVFINPIIATGDPDRDINTLVFANLKTLSESIKTDDLSREWTLRLKDNLKWSDGEKITSDDVIFSVDTVLDPNSHSPLITDFSGVTMTRVSELEIKFTLPSSFSFFGNTIEKFQPIPKHIFGNIPAANFSLSNFVKEPIGSGPYSFYKYDKDRSGFIKEYRLKANDLFSGDAPYIKTVSFYFYDSEEKLIKSYNDDLIDGFPLNDSALIPDILVRHETKALKSNRYYAVFLNPNIIANFKIASIRRALSKTAPRDFIVSSIFSGYGEPSYAPLQSDQKPDFSNDLTVNGLTFRLTYPNVKNLTSIARILKESWETNGASISLDEERPESVQEIIKNRSYEAILFGNILNNPWDLYSLWHSSRQAYPGLNLSYFGNKEADSLMERIRIENDPQKQEIMVNRLNSIIMNESPAIFIASPDYLYIVSSRLKGFSADNIITSSDRLSYLSHWYLKTTRRFK